MKTAFFILIFFASFDVMALPLCDCDDESTYCSDQGLQWDGSSSGQACSGGTGTMACGNVVCNSPSVHNDQYRVNVGASMQITEYSVCKKVTNSTGALPIMISAKTSAEWSNFYTNASIPGVTIGSCNTTVCPAVNNAASQCSYPASPAGLVNGYCGSGYTTCECQRTCNSNGTWGTNMGTGCVPSGWDCP